MAREDVRILYASEAADQWGPKTMEHASGIWGRDPMLKYLRDDIIQEGDRVVDFGCGQGYPTMRVAEMVGDSGRIVGVDYSRSQLGLGDEQSPLHERYGSPDNVEFRQGDVKRAPLTSDSMDKGVSFMVLHNLEISEVRLVFKEMARVLKDGGKAVFLTMHPEVLDSEPWDLDFWKYDDEDIETYRAADDKEGVKVRGTVQNVSGGEKKVTMYNHTRQNIMEAIQDAQLNLISEIPLFVDEKTAKEKFGSESTKKVPNKPVFWMITVEK